MSTTVVVVDSFVSDRSDEELYCLKPIDFTLRNKLADKTTEIFFRTQKPILSAQIEAATEYCRIVFDLFPLAAKPTKNETQDASQVAVIVPQEDKSPPIQLQGSSKKWKGTPQNIRSFIEWLGNHKIDTKTSKIAQSLQESIKILHNSKKTTTKRLICFTHKKSISDDDPAHTIRLPEKEETLDIVEFASQALEELQKNQVEQNPLEMTLICSTTNDIRTEPISPILMQSGNIQCTVYIVKIDELLKNTQRLASLHFRLRSIRITDIPMKEGDKERITYDVLLLHPAEEHSLNSDSHEHCSIALDTIESNELTLQWKNDKTLNKTAMRCSCVHRLTTVSLFSSPTQCLTRYLIGQKPVTLVHRSTEGNARQSVTHLIILQGYQMYLHCLKDPFVYPAREEGMRKFLDFYSENNSSLRTNAFGSLVDSNILHPRPSSRDTEEITRFALPVSESDTQHVLSSSNMIENTMWFPYYIHSTVLCQPQVSQELNNMLGVLYHYFTNSTLTQTDITTGQQILQKLFQGKQTNDVSLFPGTSTTNRTKFYEVLWQELMTLSNRSKNFYKDKKSSELSNFVDSLFVSSQEQGSTPESMQIESSPQQPQQVPQKTTAIRTSSPTRSGSNSGDLTHTGNSLEQVRKRHKFSHRPDPFEFVDKSSLFSTYWNSKLNHIPAVKKDVL